MKSLARIALLFVLALVVLSMVVPNTALSFLRSEYRWLGSFVNRVEWLWPGVDMDHVVAFATLGAAARLALGPGHTRWAVLSLALVAAGTEFIQFWVPGRTALVADALLDVAGGLAGYLAVALLGVGAGLLSRPRPDGS